MNQKGNGYPFSNNKVVLVLDPVQSRFHMSYLMLNLLLLNSKFLEKTAVHKG